MPRRIKFEAVDKNGKPHKRASVSRLYSHCVVIHFAARAPNKFCPRGRGLQPRPMGGHARTRRAQGQPLAQGGARARGRGARCEAGVMPFPKARSHELAS